MVAAAALVFPMQSLFMAPPFLFLILGGSPKPPEFCLFMPKTVWNPLDESGNSSMLKDRNISELEYHLIGGEEGEPE